MKIKFNDSDKYIKLQGYATGKDIVTIVADGIKENLSGFIIYGDDEATEMLECSDYVYRWDIYEQRENQIIFTNSETYRQRKPSPSVEPPAEIVDPLTNEELTEAVANLMYEMSLSQLGL